MRTDFETLRELINGFSAGSGTRPGEPTSDGLAARRPRPPLACLEPDVLAPGPQAAYPYELHRTFERRSSSTSYGAEPLAVEPLLGMVRDAWPTTRAPGARTPLPAPWSRSSSSCARVVPSRASTGCGSTASTASAPCRTRRRSRA